MAKQIEGAVVITGASTGIGRACALAMDKAGYRVFAGVRKDADGASLREEASERLVPLAMDVIDERAIERGVARVASELAGAPLVGLVNNAGISMTAPLESQPLADVRKQFEVNVIGAIAVTQAFLPLLRAGKGRLVFVGAAAGRVALPFFGAYSASKFAIEAVADALRIELSPWGIHVAMIEPGSIDTPIFAKMEFRAEELAKSLRPGALELYESALRVMFEVSGKTHARAIGPDAVAKAVLHSLGAKSPKTRYPVGADAKLLSWVARKLPDTMRDALIANTIGLKT